MGHTGTRRRSRLAPWAASALALLVVAPTVQPGCVYTKAPCFPDMHREARQRLARVEFTTDEVNPEDGALSRGVMGWGYCSSPPCTIVQKGAIFILARAPKTWIDLAYQRVRDPGRGVVPLSHEARQDGSRVRIDDGRGHERHLHIDIAALAQLYSLGKGDRIELTLHSEETLEVERYYFEFRRVRGSGVPDRVDLDVAVGVVAVPEGARDVDGGPDSRTRWDVARATFPLAVQVSLGWNTVSRSTPLAELADRLDLVLALAVATFEGLPSGLESKTTPIFGPGIRVHRLLNIVWYYDLFGRDPVTFPAIAVSVDEGMRLASSFMRTDVIYKSPEHRRFRVSLRGGPAGSWKDVGSTLIARNRDELAFPTGHLSYGRVWSRYWTFPQVDAGVTWIPQAGSDDDLVFLQFTLGPRFSLPAADWLDVGLGAQVGAYQGYLLREEATNESRMRMGLAIPLSFTFPLNGQQESATWFASFTTTLHTIFDFAGSGDWSNYVGAEFGTGVEF